VIRLGLRNPRKKERKSLGWVFETQERKKEEEERGREDSERFESPL